MKQRIGLIGNIPLVIGDEHEVTSNEILIELSKTDPNKIDIKRRINGKLKTLTSSELKTKIVLTKRHKVGKFIHHIRPNIRDIKLLSTTSNLSFTIPAGVFRCDLDLRDGWHILCPSFMFKMDLIKETAGNLKIGTHWFASANYKGTINGSTNSNYNNELYIVVKPNDHNREYAKYIIKVTMDSIPHKNIGAYLYYIILVQDGHIITQSDNTIYLLSNLVLDYLPITHHSVFDPSNEAPINNIFIDNGVSMSKHYIPLLINSEKYIRILKDYISCRGWYTGGIWGEPSIINGIINSKLFNIISSLGNLRCPFFKINSNIHFYK